MLKTVTITSEDILQQVKLSCKTPEILQEIITRKIVVAATEEIGIEVEDQALQKTADTLRFINHLKSAEQTWLWLQKHHLSIDDFEKIAYNNFIYGELAKHLFADKIEPYFFENQLDYVGAVIYELVLDDEDLAIELYYTIKEGEMSFYDVAHTYIQDTELRRKCGYRGIVHRKDLKPEISAAVFAAKPPQLLKPIVTSSGINLILVEEIVQPELDEKLRNQIIADYFSEWVKQQIYQMEIIPDF
ncbi:peptidylprolyl isomerase [Brasilonema octagenarum UFV-E1]|uniref:peptidylprolyl isomerase n=2 Tax=Brasilonema TaxID=383614 RepID=A0A856MC85_9CYAN|nr:MULTISPECIES: peptidylprolyl isomerase [Brasilonema]NMF62017.1 peptidylprolyl isomerase [Brasilonema octagenarum UFV-OR1]QDL07301.1 peptidylprolyl isomerase [Brasilonema sennae CENA114]QDL13665.1 peptidylprolyl isomerase [Brasilonema octagenarum UFV-E1]